MYTFFFSKNDAIEARQAFKNNSHEEGGSK